MNFYKINPKKYLFGKSDTPEEQVRQWMLYELIDSYGYPILSIETEYKIQVGSGSKRADIVALYDDKPLLVVECKRLGANIDITDNQLRSYMKLMGCLIGIKTNGINTIIYDGDREIKFIPLYHLLANRLNFDVLDIHEYFIILDKIMKSKNLSDLKVIMDNTVFCNSDLYKIICLCNKVSDLLLTNNVRWIEGAVINLMTDYMNLTGMFFEIENYKISGSNDLGNLIHSLVNGKFNRVFENNVHELWIRLLELTKTFILYPRDKYLIYKYIYENYLSGLVSFPLFDYYEYSSRFKEICNA